MKVKFRNYTSQMRFTEDYNKVHEFLIRVNKQNPISPNFLWGRWEWMFSLPYLDEKNINKIGIWEDADKVVALATYESGLGDAYLIVDEVYSYLKEEMISYAKDNLSKDGDVRINIHNNDRESQLIARKYGFKPTNDKEEVAVINITDDIKYTLPDGYNIVSLEDNFDLKKYNEVLYKGFDHGDDVPNDDKQMETRRISLSGPNNILSLKIAVQAPSGDFVSYCGMWYDKRTENALVEPVATMPEYRKKGLGKAAVLEGVIRCGKLGAKRAYVGSGQQFYYNIGFDPIRSETFWKLKKLDKR